MTDHSNILHDFWRWLPAFRAVAEAEHLPTAARGLHVSPSALSRTIHLVEDAVGAPLFARQGRRLRLGARGRLLLDAVRQATEAVRHGLRDLDETPSGEVRLSSLGPITNAFLVPCLLDLMPAFPRVLPSIVSALPREANAALVSGRLDLALVYHATPDPNVASERLGEIRSSVYCGKGHPLWTAKRATLREATRHAFSVPHVDDTGANMDEWPPDLTRNVGLRIGAIATQIEVLRSGRLLAVLPDPTAAPLVKAGDLRRVCPAPGAPTVAHAVRATASSGHPYLEALLQALRRRFAPRPPRRTRARARVA